MISRAQGELQSLRGLFTSRRRRELEAEITEHQKIKNAVDAEIPALEKALARAKAARREEPVAPDIPDEREVYYSCAGIYREAHMYEEAWKIYNKIKGFKDVDSIMENDDNIAALAAAATTWRAQFEVGNTVAYGSYKQEEAETNGTKPIEWIVLKKDEQTATLISKYGLDCKPYNKELTAVTWNTCTLRKWLNDEFLNIAFSTEEQARLETVTVKADRNPKYSTDPGNDTQDKVWLLSTAEVNVLFSNDDARKCQATAYAKAQGVFVGDNENTWWWLRSPGDGNRSAAFVLLNGSVIFDGNLVDYSHRAIRPVVVLRIS